MSWLPLSFGFPAILFGLIALPVIWWLLRLTPPRPQTEVFPPLQILARVLKKEETPHQSPWWLTLLRLLMAALVVLALAEPIYNPRQALPSGGNALALVIDNGWASAGDWDKRVATAERLIADAEKNERRIVLAFTAEKSNTQIGPFTGQEARERLNAVKPRPVPIDRPDVYARVAKALVELPGSDGRHSHRRAGDQGRRGFLCNAARTKPGKRRLGGPGPARHGRPDGRGQRSRPLHHHRRSPAGRGRSQIHDGRGV